ncbi:MAG: hypothetical protein JWQ39_169 [Glaciihabitans sp.]|jgi:hypothetical protein|nr:hypothetical protein [Glaciihabitans sp.]
MSVLILLLLTGAPALAFATLVPGLDPAARVVVSAAASTVMAGLVAEVMLLTGLWSPAGGVAAMAGVSAVLAGVSLAIRRHRRTR